MVRKILTLAVLLQLVTLTSCRKDETFYCYLVYCSEWGNETIIKTYAEGGVFKTRKPRRECAKEARYWNQENETSGGRYLCDCGWTRDCD